MFELILVLLLAVVVVIGSPRQRCATNKQSKVFLLRNNRV